MNDRTEPPMDQGASPRAWFRWLALFVVVAAGLAFDLWSKHWMFDRLGAPGGRTEWIIEPYVGFQTTLNHGALFGIGQGKSWLFALLSFVAISGVGWWLWRGQAIRSSWLLVALGFVLAGILGNLFDRLGLHGIREANGEIAHAVRDFVLLRYGAYVWPNFNIADSLLVCGAIMLGISLLGQEARDWKRHRDSLRAKAKDGPASAT